jgi:very-short-patch-repair endonuclease
MNEDIRKYGLENKSWREKINGTARELRKNQTESEKIVWEIIRGRKLSGKKFLRQYPIIYTVYQRPYYFFADFYCFESKLIIEIDGSIHDVTTEHDWQRSDILETKGFRILRISNDELADPEKVKNKIIAYL